MAINPVFKAMNEGFSTSRYMTLDRPTSKKGDLLVIFGISSGDHGSTTFPDSSWWPAKIAPASVLTSIHHWKVIGDGEPSSYLLDFGADIDNPARAVIMSFKIGKPDPYFFLPASGFFAAYPATTYGTVYPVVPGKLVCVFFMSLGADLNQWSDPSPAVDTVLRSNMEQAPLLVGIKKMTDTILGPWTATRANVSTNSTLGYHIEIPPIGGLAPPLRQRQRDDSARVRGPNGPKSKQRSVRQGWKNTYL